jgi:hypothetical protein
MICNYCGVWYDPQVGCDHRVIAMNKAIGYVLCEDKEPE